jgi:hypothetical protein
MLPPPVLGFLKKVLSWRPPLRSLGIGARFDNGTASLSSTESPERKLEALCEKLLREKKLLTSGKLQLIGLSSIKRRMAKRWEPRRLQIYAIVEKVFKENTSAGELYFRYKEDTYIIIFGSQDLAESTTRTTQMADEIRRRLYISGDLIPDEIGVLGLAQQTNPSLILGKSLEEMVATFSLGEDGVSKLFTDADAMKSPNAVKTVQVKAESSRNPEAVPKQKLHRYSCRYVPLWNIAQNMISASLAHSHDIEGTPFEKDLAILEIVSKDIRLAKPGGDFLMLCPLTLKTLSHLDQGKQYLTKCHSLLKNHTQNLIFVISDLNSFVPASGALSLLPQLRIMCKYVCAEVPINDKMPYRIWAEAGFEGLKFTVPDVIPDEHKLIADLASAASYASEAKIRHTFATNINSRSLVSTMTCMGFEYLGGSAVHSTTEKPMTKTTFTYESLFSHVIKK